MLKEHFAIEQVFRRYLECEVTELFLHIEVELMPGLFKDIGQPLCAHFADPPAKYIVEQVGLKILIGFVVAEGYVDCVRRLALKCAFVGCLYADVGIDFNLRFDQRDIGVDG